MPNRRTVREGERFKCPYPGCKRSFAELWRLKVHYRAPPDVRGSGKERGHGQELAQCPQCGARLLPGKHHIQCSAARPKRGEASMEIVQWTARALQRVDPDAKAKGAEKNGKGALKNANATANQKARAPDVPIGSNGYTAEPFNVLGKSTTIPPTVHVPAHWASTNLGQAQPDPSASQQVHGYTGFSQEQALPSSWAHPGYILAPQPQQHEVMQSQHSQQKQSLYGQSRESVHAVPHGLQHMQQHAAPVQYTNTFVREAVPGNPKAANCSLQTDLCGAVWPLNQPFPIIAPSVMHGSHPAYTILTSAQAWGSNRSVPAHVAGHAGNGFHLPAPAMQGHTHSAPTSTLADSTLGSKASHLSAQSAVPAFHVHGSMMPTPENDMGATVGVHATAVATSSNQVQQPAAEKATQMNHQQPQQQHHQARQQSMPLSMEQVGAQPTAVKMEVAHENQHHSSTQGFGRAPSPPASPPPDIIDLPFDFGKFDEVQGVQSGHMFGSGVHSGQSMPGDEFNEMDSIFDMPAITDSEDMFKIFTHDNHGNPMITSHIHHRMPVEDHGLEFVSNVFDSSVGPADFDADLYGGHAIECRMANNESESKLGSVVSAHAVVSPSYAQSRGLE